MLRRKLNLSSNTISLIGNFLVQLIATFPATLLGVWIAFRLEKRREKDNERVKQKHILSALKQELAVNLHQLIPAIRKNIEETRLPFAPISMDIWEAIPDKTAILSEHSLGIIGNAYYNLRSLEKALDRLGMYTQSYLTALDEKSKIDFKTNVQSVISVIFSHIRESENPKDRTVVSTIKEAILEIDNELKRLDNDKIVEHVKLRAQSE